MSLLHTLRTHIPERWLRPYHYVLARASAWCYGNPSQQLIVIGVTGTKGKSSTVQMLAQLLTACGERVGYTSTAGFAINGKEIVNRMKMTMPGRFFLQRTLRDMVRAGCRYAIVETSSQGVVQYRHAGIAYDVAVFTNLTPEHIEAHGGFAAYRAAKGAFFAHLSRSPRKVLDGVLVQKTIVVNADDEHAAFFAAFSADRKVAYGWGANGHGAYDRVVTPTNVQRDGTGLAMAIDGVALHVPLLALFEQQNALCALATLVAIGVPLERLAEAALHMRQVPGRFERIACGQPFTVIVDYAYEPASIAALLASVRQLGVRRIIGVHGSAGGGRDVARRAAIGRLAAQEEDVVIVTNEDPYDEDPAAIIRMVADGAREEGKRDGVSLFTFSDRQEAIDAAIAHAEPGDAVVVTGKGSEPVMAVAGGRTVPWDDRDAARHALAKRGFCL